MRNAFQFRSLLGMNQPETDISASKSAHQRRDNVRSDDVPGGNAHSESDLHVPHSHANRSLQVRQNLDLLMRHIEHARHDADQMMEEMCALEVDAGQATALRRENDILRQKLDDSSREKIAEAARAESVGREITRLKEELARIRSDYEKSEREANANALDAERIEDQLRAAVNSLSETKRDLEMEREAKDKAEVDAACLRANLVERDRAQSTLLQQETELRMQAAKLQTQYEEVTDALVRKERSLLEKSAELEGTRDRIADIEAEAETSRDELRILNNRYSDLKVSQDSRIYSLNDGLSQERDSHRMTRKLLEETRMSNDAVSDENASLKDQATAMTKDNEKLKRELNALRSQIHEYGDKLKEEHIHFAAAQGDIQRLEATLEDTKKDAISLQRQASKSDQLLRENSDLHDKIASMQRSLDRYRHKELLDDVPILLSTATRETESPAKKGKPATVSTTNQNVARIARR